MPGRETHQGRGNRGGRGRGRDANRNKRRTHAKKSLSDYIYYLGSAKQASDYEKTTEYLINYVQKTFSYGNDIATALEQLSPYDVDPHKPSLQVSTSTDASIKALEDEQYKIEFKAEFDGFMKRKLALETNMSKAYAFLWEQCAKGMQNKVEARSDFASQIKGNPIELLKAIKQHALNYQEHRYEMSIISDALRTLLNTKQKDFESLQDYTKRFKTAIDVLTSHIGGPIELTKYMETMPGYVASNPDAVKTCRENAYKQFLAFLYLDNADRSKYGSLLHGLQTQQSLGNNQYPTTITEANNVLSEHKFDTAPNKKNKTQDEDRIPEDPLTLSFAQLEGRCYCCGKKGHNSPKCREKNKPKSEWVINKIKEQEQSHANVDEQSTMPSDQASVASASASTTAGSTPVQHTSVGWSSTLLANQFYQASKLRDLILLDSESSTSIFCNPSYVTNIRTTDSELELLTNGGVLKTNQKAEVPNFGEVWYSPASITNIFSLADMEDKHRVTYDSSKESALIVHLPDRQVRFCRSANNLFARQPGDKQVALINTVEENKLPYTDRQLQRAKKARELYHALGTPSLTDLKAIIRMNAIRNNPITLEDIKIAENIFGPDIGSLKGKQTRTKPLPVVSDYIEIPREIIAAQQHITLCMDTMKVNGLLFLTTISRNIMYRTAEFMPSAEMTEYDKIIGRINAMYQHAGFNITTIHCDREYAPLADLVQQKYGILMNFANAQEHVPEAERNNRVIKERCRATFHRLPYKRLPRVMIKVLTMESAKKLNFFPPKGGVSEYYSPRMILHSEQVDYNKHCAIPFGTYVQALQENNPTNTQEARSLDCIYLRYLTNQQGGHELLHLGTGRLITRRQVTPIPLTQSVIDLVHAMAEREGIPEGLKIINKHGITLYDSSWIAGVDYDDDEEYQPSDDDSDDDDPDDEEYYDRMDPNEVADILNDSNPTEIIEEEEEQEVNEDNEPEEEVNEDNEAEQPANNNEEEEQQQEPAGVRTRSGREVRIPERFRETSHLNAKTEQTEWYGHETAKVIARNICAFNEMARNPKHKHHSFIQTYSLGAGLKKFGRDGHDAAAKEMKQLHQRKVFKPIHINDLTEQERKRAMESLIFLSEKRDGTIKARTCANGSTQRAYMSKDEATSPTVMTESIMITAALEAAENRDIMTADIPNAFVQTDVKYEEDDEKIIMKIRGALVDMLVDLDPDTYKDFVVYEGRKNSPVLYMVIWKAIYGMLQSSLLFYKKFRADIQTIGFVINPYDPCVANRVIEDKQQTVSWHVDDLKASHVKTKCNDELAKWLEEKYGDPAVNKMKVTRGKRHDYLGMTLDYSTPGQVKIDMSDYVKTMVEDFPEQLSGNTKCPWNENLFKVDKNSKKLSKQQHEVFHTFVAKGLFAAKRARPDIMPAIAYLTTRVRNPTEHDWFKLKRMMDFLKNTANDGLTLKANLSVFVQWYVDAAFAVHDDYKSHTGACLTLGKGVATPISTKQKVNSRSSTESELVATDDIISKVIWTKHFIEAQGYQVKENIIHRDNQSTMKLEQNGKASSGKRTRHFNIKYFYITDLIQRDEITIKYCPTDQMIADYFTKPLTGQKFHYFRSLIMNLP